MNYVKNLKCHFQPKKGWMNDPNGLVFFKGYYHLFYQYVPNQEVPGKMAMCWGHARTKDFLHFEELPVALSPDAPYDINGCWSGTAIVKDDTLYLFYASILTEEDGKTLNQTVSVAYSKDGINFLKSEANPVISRHPEKTGNDFRDPAVMEFSGKYYLAVAAGNQSTLMGYVVLYESDDLISWKLTDYLKEWENCIYTECPSFIKNGDKVMLSLSVCPHEKPHYFNIMFGQFDGRHFIEELTGSVDNGPDQYAGQAFEDNQGRILLISWIPGWRYIDFAKNCISCLSVPREIKEENGKVTAYPIKELQHLLKENDECLIKTDDGFTVLREHHGGNQHIVGKFDTIEMIRDEYVLEVYVNKGEAIYTFIL